MADTLDKLSAEGLDQAVEKAFKAAEKDVYEYEGKTYTAHPAAMLFPLLRGDDFDGLVASLEENGMRQPIVLLGDQIIDGRNRFRAAKQAGVKMIFRQLDPDEDICLFVLDMNIHRRDLSAQRKIALASTLRRMSIRLEAMRREAMREAVREAREKEAAAAPAAGAGPDAPSDGTGGVPAGSGGGAAEDGGAGPDGAPAAGVDAAAAEAAAEKPPSALDAPSSSLVSRQKAADLAGVSRRSLERFDKVVETAPELQEPIADKTLTVSDAAVVSEEDPELRRQVVEDVKAGRAKTGAQAIEKRTGRAPKARSRLKASAGAKTQPEGAGGVAGMPPLPTVGGAAGGKDGAGASGSAAPAAPSVASGDVAPERAPRPLLPALALSPGLLLAGVRKVMPMVEFDPCSSDAAQQRIRAKRYLTQEQDGCSQAWDGASYVFPPPQFAGRFASKLMGEMLAGRVPRALFLAPSDLADEDEGVLLRNSQLSGIVHELQRSDFDVEGGKSVKAPSRMVLYVFGIDRKLLYDAFDPWGKVLTVSSGR